MPEAIDRSCGTVLSCARSLLIEGGCSHRLGEGRSDPGDDESVRGDGSGVCIASVPWGWEVSSGPTPEAMGADTLTAPPQTFLKRCALEGPGGVDGCLTQDTCALI